MYRSQRKTISGLEDMNQIIIEKLTNGVIVFQQDHVILHANESAKKLLGIDEIIFFPDEILQYIKSDKDGMVYHANNGMDLYIRKASVTEEQNFGVLFIEDSSFLKKAAQQLNLASLGKLSSSIAHEIRNPLAAISTAAELLVESPDLKGQDKQISEIIVNQTRRANHIIEDILQMSRRKTANPQELNISEQLREVKQQLIDEVSVDSKNVQIIAAKTATISFDPDHFKQVIWNLASNALKHGENNELTMVVHDNVLDFKNQGSAFDDKKIQNLFEPFFTTHNRGTGLGLHICRQLCHDNHATLDYLYINGQHVFRLEFNLM
jgi:two-component system sensor histidine kinase PilS (NtrC family)